jgi:hypothetical protein
VRRPAKGTSVPGQLTIEIPIGPEERRAISQHVTTWSAAILLAPVAGVVVGIAVLGALGPAGGLVSALAGVAFAVLIIAWVLAKGWLLRRERALFRTTGPMKVEIYGERYTTRYVMAAGRKVWLLDAQIPGARMISAIDYTKGEAYPMAIFDATGRLAWTRPGYVPRALAVLESAGTDTVRAG